MRKKILAVFLLFLLSGCAYIGYAKDPFVSIPNFYQVDDNLYSGGQPGRSGIERLKDLGIKTVLSLRGSDEETSEESQLLKDQGIKFYNIPLSVYKRPSDEQVMEFLEIVLDKSNQPVFIHCKSGRDRTGAMIALYWVVVKDWTIKEAYQKVKSKGFWPYRGDAELKKFIHQLKCKPEYFEKAKSLKNG